MNVSVAMKKYKANKIDMNIKSNVEQNPQVLWNLLQIVLILIAER